MSQSFEQLWYTASPVGLNGTPGWQVRAASAGLLNPRSERLQHLSNYLQYQLPPGVRPQSVRPEDTPVCLAWLNTEIEYILVYKTFVGLTWDRRPGNYFTHLVVNLPSSFTARDAIDLWGSAFWKNTDTLAPQQLELPGVTAAELVKGHLKLEDLLAPEIAGCLLWLIEAFLSLLPSQRIIIVAPDHTVAAMIWGMTRCVPSVLLRSLTFSTYEANVTVAYAPLITGTSYPASLSAGTALDPRAIFASSSVFVINCYTRQISQRASDRDIIAFAAYATEQLLSGDTAGLDELVQYAEQLAVKDVQGFLFVYRFAIDRARHARLGHPRAPGRTVRTLDSPWLSPRDLIQGLDSPQRAAALLDQHDELEMLLALAFRDVGFWQTQIRPRLRRLVAHASVDNRSALHAGLRQLAVQGLLQAELAIRERQQWRAACLVDLATTSYLAREQQIWQILFDDLSSDLQDRSVASMYTWETRSWLFQNWYEHLGASLPHQWLQMPWSEVRLLLATNLPDDWKVIALAQLIADVQSNSPPCALLRELASTYQHEMVKTLKWMACWGHMRPTIVSFFDHMCQCRCKHVSDLLAELLAAFGDDTGHAEALLACAPLDSGELRQVLETHYPQILPGLAGHAWATRIVAAYLDNLTMSDLSPQVIAVLRAIEAEAKPTSAMYIIVSAWLTVIEYLERPSLERAPLADLAGAVGRLSDSRRRAIASSIFSVSADIIRSQHDIIRLLIFLEATFGQHPAYYQLLFEHGIVRHTGPIALETLLAYAQFVLEPDNRRAHEEQQQTFKFLAMLGETTLDSIRSKTCYWSAEAQASWNKLERQHRPPPASREAEGLFGRMKKALEKWNDS